MFVKKNNFVNAVVSEFMIYVAAAKPNRAKSTLYTVEKI